ncbi:putative PPPDE peptidase domain-containing protein [Helianthus annuus]|nr:putative PPPDE peptidase domain-containing protein [Helianthus annuus]
MRLFPLISWKEQKNTSNNHALMYLNVYDLTPVNNYMYWFGLGVFHSGIEGTQFSNYFHISSTV